MSAEATPPPELDPDDVGPVCLVTGGRGYLGSHLVERLAQLGCTVRSFDIAPDRGAPRERVEHRVGDVRLQRDVRTACEGVDVVFHTVALIKLLARARPEIRRRVFDVNVLGTQQVIRACRATRVGRLVHTSTFNVAMGAPVRDGDESTPTVGKDDLLDLYSETKSIAEREVLAADAPGGLRTVALRPGGIWGAGEGCMMIASFVEQLAAGRFKVLVGDGTAVLDNTYVGSATDAHLLAAQALARTPERVGGQAYFITDGEPMNGMEWFRPLVEGLGHRWPRRRIPGWLMLRIAHGLEWLHFLGGPEPMLTHRGVLNLIQDASFRIDKAREDLGYVPRVRSAEGLRAILPDVKAQIDRQLSQ